MRVKFPQAAVYLAMASVFVAVLGCSTESAAQTIQTINAEKAYELVQGNNGNGDFVIVDVRTPAEFADARLANALNINLESSSFRTEMNRLDRSDTYLLYCRTGNRSAQAASIMKDLGFEEVYDMGGIVDWASAGYPVVR